MDRTFTQLVNLNSTDITRPSGVDADASSTWNWYQLNADGTFRLCTDATTSCFHWAQVAAAGNANDVVVEVTSRSRCQGGALSTTVPLTGMYTGGNCVVSKYQQRMRRKQYFDYLQFTVKETIPDSWVSSPAGRTAWNLRTGDPAPQVYWSAADVANGPVRTDGKFGVCGSKPTFKQGIFSPSPTFATAGTCPSVAVNGSGSSIVPSEVSKMGMPQQTETTKLYEVAAASESAFLANPNNPLPRNVVFTLSQDVGKYSLDGGLTLLDYPKSGVLYFSSDVYVRGTVKGRITVVSASNIYVNGDLLYRCLGADNTAQRSALQGMVQGVSAPSCDDALGLIAGKAIALACGDTITDYEQFVKYNGDGSLQTSQSCASADDRENRYLVGALLALEDGIGAQRWATGGNNMHGVLPNLYFYGSMASKYRPLFGLAAAGTGTPMRGLNKQFVFDANLKNRQPPYFLEPTNAQWERIDFTEVTPCAAGLNGVVPKGAGC